MTEAEWLACAHPLRMLAFLRGKVSNRKFRLFACQCCRTVSLAFPTAAYHELIECAERYAEGLATKRVLDEKYRAVARHSNSILAMAACGVADASASYAARKTVERIDVLEGSTSHLTQARLLREIVGTPSRFASVLPEWLTSDVLALASGIYAEKAFDRLPILADALLDAGCTDADILSHLRSPGPHVRGCWALDLILAKK